MTFERGFLFYDPDLFGAVGILHFVQPGTALPALVTSFAGISDGNFNAGERLEFFAFDGSGNEVARDTDPGSLGPIAAVGIESVIPFSSLEIRTFGNPGIAVGNLSFKPVPEVTTSALFGSMMLLSQLFRRHKRNA